MDSNPTNKTICELLACVGVQIELPRQPQLKPLLFLNPRVVVTLGYMAYRSLLKAYEMRPKPGMREAVQETAHLPRGSVFVPVYHPSINGTGSLSLENQ